MHRFQSRSTLIRLRFAALLLGLKYLLAPTAVSLLIAAIIYDSRHWMLVAVGLGGFTILTIFMQWILAARPRCPLCLTPILASKRCSKHRKAQTFLGSHRLRVAIAILFRGRFLCSYCNEPSAMEIRTKQTGPRTRRR
jgi:hypothetical protein